MGVLQARDNSRVQVSEIDAGVDANSLESSEASKSLIIKNVISEGSNDYVFFASVPITKVSKLCSFLDRISNSEDTVNISDDSLRAYYKGDGAIQNRECPVCGKSDLPGWVIAFGSNPAFYIHSGECLESFAEAHDDLLEIEEEFIHQLI